MVGWSRPLPQRFLGPKPASYLWIKPVTPSTLVDWICSPPLRKGKSTEGQDAKVNTIMQVSRLWGRRPGYHSTKDASMADYLGLEAPQCMGHRLCQGHFLGEGEGKGSGMLMQEEEFIGLG